MQNIPWQVFRKNFHNIGKHSGIAEWLVRDLAIEDDTQIKIKATLAYNNQSYVKWCD